MDQRVCLLILPILTGCAGAPAAGIGAHAATALPSVQPTARASERAHALGEGAAVPPKALPAAPLEYDDTAATAQIFVDNTTRAIALYREFIERAGSDPQYAPAIRRSREQIQDLNDTLKFVRSGVGDGEPK